MKKIYLDFNATTPMLPKVQEKLISMIQDNNPYNSSASHSYGRLSRTILENSREILRNTLKVPDDFIIIFTSSGTEANNLAINGMKKSVNYLYTSNIEHPSVSEVVFNKAIEVDNRGLYDENKIDEILKNHEKDKVLFSLMLANNEVGTVEDIANISKKIKSHGHFIHTDGVQAIGKINVDISKLSVDLITISGHKFGAPIGAGALIAKTDLELQPIIRGGGQEHRYRSGTVNLTAVQGLAIAASQLSHLTEIMTTKVVSLRNYLEDEIKTIGQQAKDERIKPVIFAEDTLRLPNTSSIAMPGIRADTQVAYFDSHNIAISAGSACSSAKASSLPHVQMAMGYDYDLAKTAIRVSMGTTTTKEEVNTFLQKWKDLYHTISRSKK